MAAISEYENDPASANNPAVSQTSNTILALPTLQVITRVLRKTPVPIMLATFTATAPHAPTPRVNSPLAFAAKAALLIWCSSISQMKFDFSQIVAYLTAILVVFLIYRRLRRSFGQQPLRPARMSVR